MCVLSSHRTVSFLPIDIISTPILVVSVLIIFILEKDTNSVNTACETE